MLGEGIYALLDGEDVVLTADRAREDDEIVMDPEAVRRLVAFLVDYTDAFGSKP